MTPSCPGITLAVEGMMPSYLGITLAVEGMMPSCPGISLAVQGMMPFQMASGHLFKTASFSKLSKILVGHQHANVVTF